MGAAAGALACSWDRAWSKYESGGGGRRNHTKFTLSCCAWQAKEALYEPKSVCARSGNWGKVFGVGMCGMVLPPLRSHT